MYVLTISPVHQRYIYITHKSPIREPENEERQFNKLNNRFCKQNLVVKGEFHNLNMI